MYATRSPTKASLAEKSIPGADTGIFKGGAVK